MAHNRFLLRHGAPIYPLVVRGHPEHRDYTLHADHAALGRARNIIRAHAVPTVFGNDASVVNSDLAPRAWTQAFVAVDDALSCTMITNAFQRGVRRGSPLSDYRVVHTAYARVSRSLEEGALQGAEPWPTPSVSDRVRSAVGCASQRRFGL
jgi:hypothetical protein